jgi:hypothetical protein
VINSRYPNSGYPISISSGYVIRQHYLNDIVQNIFESARRARTKSKQSSDPSS